MGYTNTHLIHLTFACVERKPTVVMPVKASGVKAPAPKTPAGAEPTAIPAASGVVAVKAVKTKRAEGVQRFDPSVFAPTAAVSGWD